MPQDIPLVGPVINRIFGTRNERFVRRYNQRVDAINALEPKISVLADSELRAETGLLRNRVKNGEAAVDLLIDAFAVAREAMDRAVGIRNSFNPKFRDQFEKDRLEPSVRALYEKLIAEMDAATPRDPVDDLLGNAEPQAGWVWMDIPVEIYQAVRAIYPLSKPPFRARPFDVQLIGGMVLVQGKIAEMKTGEGKTIVAPLAAYLAVIEGFKVHVVTVNDYLVQRDRDWTFPYFRALGLTVGAIHPQHMQTEDVKRLMYQCDVVYGTTSEFGFDYLRDNMKRAVDQQVQRVREYAIVDEVDSILIDEARTPLIISGPAHEDAPRYDLADKLARHLVDMQKEWDAVDRKVDECKKLIKGTEGDIRNARDKAIVPELQKRLEDAKARLPQIQQERDQFVQYYEVERDRKQVHLTHRGINEAQKKAGIGSFYVGENMDVPHLLEQSLRAHVVYERDRDYVVMNAPDPATGKSDMAVVIVDVNTGRPMYGRQWSDGLHQAVEAKEGVRIKQETQTVATITIQNFFKMYKRLSGMTGTADTEAQEFNDIYKLDVVVIPTNVPVIRRDFDDVVYLTEKDKWDSIVEEIKAMHDIGRPVLVGTTSVEKSERLAQMLSRKHNIPHQVLNAKQHEKEAHVIENAGQLGAVMIATNMAGRGTDIKLGKAPRDLLRDHWLRRGLAPRELEVADSDEALREKVYRKIAPKELGLQKREVDEMNAQEVELRLLRHWASRHTWADVKKIEGMTADQLRAELDAQGRFALHRLSWVDSIEQLGGLHVIGTERHESRRIDNQLRGRSGRQGDKGSSRFFVSLEDDLMKMFAGETTMKILSRLGMKEGDAIEHPILSKSIVRAQRKVEERNFQIRKNILEYDEVMEHQRQDFYGMRQRALDGRDLKGLIFQFIEAAAVDAVERYLDKDYRAECIAEFAREKLNCSIPIDRLRRRDFEDMVELIRKDAKADSRHEIDVTIGEYIPEGAEPVDQDLAGLENWALTRFGVQLTAAEIQQSSTKDIKDRLLEAAADRIERAELSELNQFLAPDYGAEQLSKWLKHSLLLDVAPSEIAGKENNDQVVDLVLEKVREAYTKREIEYPVDFAMQMTSVIMRQSPEQAVENLIRWSDVRLGFKMEESMLRTKMPQQIRDEFIRASRQRYESDDLQRAIEVALACKTEEELVRHFVEKYGHSLPHWILRLQGQERDDMIRARVEGALRAELVQFERHVLLEMLDSAWKDHLYQMDQLRDTIGFRQFSQQDPRIEYKREGARLYGEMLTTVRNRVTEQLFRMRLVPQMAPAPQAPRAPRPPQRVGAGSFGGSSISGPGIPGASSAGTDLA